MGERLGCYGTAITEQASIATANPKDFRKFEPFGLVLAPTEPH